MILGRKQAGQGSTGRPRRLWLCLLSCFRHEGLWFSKFSFSAIALFSSCELCVYVCMCVACYSFFTEGRELCTFFVRKCVLVRPRHCSLVVCVRAPLNRDQHRNERHRKEGMVRGGASGRRGSLCLVRTLGARLRSVSLLIVTTHNAYKRGRGRGTVCRLLSASRRCLFRLPACLPPSPPPLPGPAPPHNSHHHFHRKWLKQTSDRNHHHLLPISNKRKANHEQLL